MLLVHWRQQGYDLSEETLEYALHESQARGAYCRDQDGGEAVPDAITPAASPSTKDHRQARDPQRQRMKRCTQWFFETKVHVGSDASAGLVHALVGTPANASAISQAAHLFHGEEKAVYADAGWTGKNKRNGVKDLPIAPVDNPKSDRRRQWPQHAIR
jgi:IS5 family transposase